MSSNGVMTNGVTLPIKVELVQRVILMSGLTLRPKGSIVAEAGPTALISVASHIVVEVAPTVAGATLVFVY